MKLKEAIQRISWRFTSGKSFTANDNDAQALNSIMDFIDSTTVETVKENELFAKLFVYTLTHEIQFYSDLDFGLAKMNDVLKTPIENLYANFHKNLNNMEFMLYSKRIGISQEHPLMGLNTDENGERICDKDDAIISNNQAELAKYIKGKWDYDDVKNNLNTSITLALNAFKNINVSNLLIHEKCLSHQE